MLFVVHEVNLPTLRTDFSWNCTESIVLSQPGASGGYSYDCNSVQTSLTLKSNSIERLHQATLVMIELCKARSTCWYLCKPDDSLSTLSLIAYICGHAKLAFMKKSMQEVSAIPWVDYTERLFMSMTAHSLMPY